MTRQMQIPRRQKNGRPTVKIQIRRFLYLFSDTVKVCWNQHSSKTNDSFKTHTPIEIHTRNGTLRIAMSV